MIYSPILAEWHATSKLYHPNIFFPQRWVGLAAGIQDRISSPPHLLRLGNRARFDGAAIPSSGRCGAGAFIELSNGDHINLWLCGGRGTNTNGELLALWLVLFFSSA